MKLSEAMRLGAMLHPQGFGSMRTYRDRRGRFCRFDALSAGIRVAATCALGAVDAAGGWDEESLDWTTYDCPVCQDVDWMGCLVIDLVVHLNDHHRWTREGIADWVETVERSLEDAAMGRDDKRVASEIEPPESAQRVNVLSS